MCVHIYILYANVGAPAGAGASEHKWSSESLTGADERLSIESYLYVYIYIYIYVCVCVCIYIYIYIYVCVRVCVCLFVCIYL